MIFDKYQKKVIEAEDGHYLVLAPPGCGKTELLTHRIINAHNAGIQYDEMLCLTFTNRAARGMQERIDSVTGSRCDELFVGNIHRFCSRFLFENHIASRATGIIDELDQKDIMDSFGFTKHNENVSFRSEKISTTDVGKLASRMYQLEAGHPSEVMIREPLFSSQRASDKAKEIAAGYYEYKKQHLLMDFDDILLQTYTAMTKEDYYSFLYSQYSWIQVDEVQDLNPLQLAIIDKLTVPFGSVAVYLGDEQQAIYSFMGTKLASLQTLALRAGKEHVLRLHTNYRSPKYLLDVLNEYASTQLNIPREFLPSANIGAESEKGLLNIFSYPTDVDMLQDVSTRVGSCLKRFPDERIGILTRSNASADAVSASLEAASVPHFRLSGRDVFKTDDFKTLLSHFSLIQNDSSFLDWARILWMSSATPSFKDARDIVTRLRDAALSPSDFLFRRFGNSYIGDFLETYRNKELVIFDTETTGLDVFNDDIIQIAAVKVRNGAVVPGSGFNVIIETDRTIPSMLGKEANPMLRVYEESFKTPANVALRDFLEYVGGADVLGHNVSFDYQILRYNLLRRMGGEDLDQHIGKVWDSLSLIRLLEPRLRVYKLRALLETFGLEGQNSHRADDDIMATKSLVDFCSAKIPSKLEAQQELFADVNVQRAAEGLKTTYRPIYESTLALFASPAPVSSGGTGIVFLDELRRVYESFLRAGVMEPIQGFDYVVEFLRRAVFAGEEGTPLRSQVFGHLMDIRSFSQSDLCDSGVIKERVYVMTVHKAKGLEFEHTMLYDCRDDVYPFFSSKTSAERLEDARVLYVGLSRAKKRLTLLYPGSLKGYQKKLSPFIDESLQERFGIWSISPRKA